jgi:hypothetical protein
MSTNEGLVRRKSLLFLLLHVLAGAMLMRSDTGHRAMSAQDIQDMQLRLHD